MSSCPDWGSHRGLPVPCLNVPNGSAHARNTHGPDRDGPSLGLKGLHPDSPRHTAAPLAIASGANVKGRHHPDISGLRKYQTPREPGGLVL